LRYAETRIAVFVSGGGTNLQALIDAEACGRLNSGALALVVASKRALLRWSGRSARK
jgi:folate-dependent phosphoribosylglycinamide formyltransferase PurN